MVLQYDRILSLSEMESIRQATRADYGGRQSLKKYLKIAEDKTCHNDDQVGGANDISTPEDCREKCFTTHVETYFTLEKQSDNTIKCYCFKDCDEEDWDNATGSTIFEIISDHVAREIFKDENEIATLNKELTETENELSDTKTKLNDEIATLKKELTDTEKELTDTKNELSDTKTKLSDEEKKAAAWEKRYNDVDTNIDAAVKTARDAVFDKAEADNPVQMESAVGVVNCPQNRNPGNSWFQSTFTMTIGVVVGAAIGFYIAGDSSKAPEKELLL